MQSTTLEAKVAAALAALSIIVLLSLMDLWSGTSIRLGPLYALPVLLVAWYFGLRAGVGAALCVTALWNGVQAHVSRELAFSLVRFWDICIGLVSFCTLAVVVARFKLLLLREAQMARQLQEALEHVRTLEGLLPICAWCKRVRAEEGNWQHIETYVATHSNATWTHGICPECQMRMKTEVGQLKADLGADLGDGAAELPPEAPGVGP